MKNTERQLKECYEHIKPYMDSEETTKELREMCKRCDSYCGSEHDYEECREKPCFRFWLGYEYLKWVNSFG